MRNYKTISIEFRYPMDEKHIKDEKKIHDEIDKFMLEMLKKDVDMKARKVYDMRIRWGK